MGTRLYLVAFFALALIADGDSELTTNQTFQRLFKKVNPFIQITTEIPDEGGQPEIPGELKQNVDQIRGLKNEAPKLPKITTDTYKRAVQLRDKRKFLKEAFKRLEKVNYKSKPVFRKPPLHEGETEDKKFRFPINGLGNCKPICSSNLAVAYCQDGRLFATKKSGTPEGMRANAIEFQLGELAEIDDLNITSRTVNSKFMKRRNLTMSFVVNDRTLHQNIPVIYVAAAKKIPVLECTLAIEFYLFQDPGVLENSKEVVYVTPNDIKVKLSFRNWPTGNDSMVKERVVLKVRPPRSSPSGNETLPKKIADKLHELKSLKQQRENEFVKLEADLFEGFVRDTQRQKMETRIAEMENSTDLAADRELQHMLRQVERKDKLVAPVKDIEGASIWDIIEDDGEVQNISRWDRLKETLHAPENDEYLHQEENFNTALLGSFSRDRATLERRRPSRPKREIRPLPIDEQMKNFSDALWDIRSPDRYVLSEATYGAFSLPKKVMVDGQIVDILNEGELETFIDEEGYINFIIDIPRMDSNMSYEFYLHTPMAAEQVKRRSWKKGDFLKELVREKKIQRQMYKKAREQVVKRNITKPRRPEGGFKIVEREDCAPLEAEDVVVQYCGNRGTLFIGKKSTDMEAGSLRLQLANIEEVSINGTAVDKQVDEAALDSQARFKFTIDDDHNYQGSNVTYIAGDALLASEARIKLEFFIFKEEGTIESGDEFNFVNKGSLKMNLEVHNWTFSSPQDNHLVITFEVLPPPAARQRRSAEKLSSLAEELATFSPDAPDMKTPERYALGGDDEANGVIGFSKMVLIDNLVQEMAAEYPKVWSDDDGKRFFQIAFPSFSKTAIYDPTVEDAPLSAEEQDVMPLQANGSAPNFTTAGIVTIFSGNSPDPLTTVEQSGVTTTTSSTTVKSTTMKDYEYEQGEGGAAAAGNGLVSSPYLVILLITIALAILEHSAQAEVTPSTTTTTTTTTTTARTTTRTTKRPPLSTTRKFKQGEAGAPNTTEPINACTTIRPTGIVMACLFLGSASISLTMYQ